MKFVLNARGGRHFQFYGPKKSKKRFFFRKIVLSIDNRLSELL